MSANDSQVGGTHYVSEYQHWDFVAKCYGPGYFKGVVTKYVVRWRKKNGLEDLQKARHYLVKLTELVDEGVFSIPLSFNDSVNFAAVNGLEIYEAAIVSMVTEAREMSQLQEALSMLDTLIKTVELEKS